MAGAPGPGGSAADAPARGAGGRGAGRAGAGAGAGGPGGPAPAGGGGGSGGGGWEVVWGRGAGRGADRRPSGGGGLGWGRLSREARLAERGARAGAVELAAEYGERAGAALAGARSARARAVLGLAPALARARALCDETALTLEPARGEGAGGGAGLPGAEVQGMVTRLRAAAGRAGGVAWLAEETLALPARASAETRRLRAWESRFLASSGAPASDAVAAEDGNAPGLAFRAVASAAAEMQPFSDLMDRVEQGAGTEKPSPHLDPTSEAVVEREGDEQWLGDGPPRSAMYPSVARAHSGPVRALWADLERVASSAMASACLLARDSPAELVSVVAAVEVHERWLARRRLARIQAGREFSGGDGRVSAAGRGSDPSPAGGAEPGSSKLEPEQVLRRAAMRSRVGEGLFQRALAAARQSIQERTAEGRRAVLDTLLSDLLTDSEVLLPCFPEGWDVAAASVAGACDALAGTLVPFMSRDGCGNGEILELLGWVEGFQRACDEAFEAGVASPEKATLSAALGPFRRVYSQRSQAASDETAGNLLRRGITVDMLQAPLRSASGQWKTLAPQDLFQMLHSELELVSRPEQCESIDWDLVALVAAGCAVTLEKYASRLKSTVEDGGIRGRAKGHMAFERFCAIANDALQCCRETDSFEASLRELEGFPKMEAVLGEASVHFMAAATSFSAAANSAIGLIVGQVQEDIRGLLMEVFQQGWYDRRPGEPTLIRRICSTFADYQADVEDSTEESLATQFHEELLATFMPTYMASLLLAGSRFEEKALENIADDWSLMSECFRDKVPNDSLGLFKRLLFDLMGLVASQTPEAVMQTFEAMVHAYGAAPPAIVRRVLLTGDGKQRKSVGSVAAILERCSELAAHAPSRPSLPAGATVLARIEALCASPASWMPGAKIVIRRRSTLRAEPAAT